MLKVAVLGGSGYTGSELLRLLNSHPHVRVTSVTSERYAGTPVSEVFLHLRDVDIKFEPLDIDALSGKADLFFLCLPHRTSQKIVARLHEQGKKVIDLSADFRLKSARVYEKWYGTRHDHAGLLKKAVYGMPELYRDRIRKASIVANPGCYPTASILALAPLMDQAYVDRDSIVIDAKSGTSGAGRTPSQQLMYCEVNESVRAYAVASHRHTPEIEQELSGLAGAKLNVSFTPHLIPIDRGILSTVYVRLHRKTGMSSILRRYRSFYEGEPFVRVLQSGVLPATKSVKGTNFCDISIFADTRFRSGQRLIIVSAIDNLIKGASGAAVHNMNIMCGFDETEGLLGPAPSP
jgi:N-acetyl-gamma-glutamyl-phosphate reductase